MTASSDGAVPRLTRPLLLLALMCSFCFGAIVRIAIADDYHTTCVGHGFVQGSSDTDGSFFGRVETGCSSTLRTCDLYTWGSLIGGLTVTGPSSTCNNWSRTYGNFTECASTTHVENPGVFSDHIHKASNWCG